MPKRKPDKDIEFTVREADDGDDWWIAELKIGGQTVGTLYCGSFDDAIAYFHESFPVHKKDLT